MSIFPDSTVTIKTSNGKFREKKQESTVDKVNNVKEISKSQ